VIVAIARRAIFLVNLILPHLFKLSLAILAKAREVREVK
jgi:hypothetical protein